MYPQVTSNTSFKTIIYYKKFLENSLLKNFLIKTLYTILIPGPIQTPSLAHYQNESCHNTQSLRD